jgi:hypothetical protein
LRHVAARFRGECNYNEAVLAGAIRSGFAPATAFQTVSGCFISGRYGPAGSTAMLKVRQKVTRPLVMQLHRIALPVLFIENFNVL